jgi:hypothetical protein
MNTLSNEELLELYHEIIGFIETLNKGKSKGE